MESDEISLEEQKKEIVIDVRQICRNLPTLIRQIEIKKKALKMQNVPMKSIWKNIATG